MLRALVHERRPKVESLHGIPVDELAATAKRLRESHYATIVWSVAELPGPHADLTVQQIAKLLQELNVTGRAVGVPLVGARNPIGANQVAAWQTGLPLPVSLSAGVPDHDPWLYAVRPALTDGGDCLVWIGSFTGSAAPPEDVPTIALVRGGTVSPHEPTVVIPVGTPGIDHAGSVYRTDSVVALPLRKLRDTGLPSVADVLGALAARLEGAAC
jgi:formylmethanofuran dehydrogenase subunit B